MRVDRSRIYVAMAVAVVALGGYLVGRLGDDGSTQAQQASPTAALAGRDVYYPGSEELKPDEMR